MNSSGKNFFARHRGVTLYLLWVLFCMAIIVFLWLSYQDFDESTSGGYSQNSSAEYQAVLSKRGSTGSEVTQIQKKLKNWGYYKGNVDGIFGKQTEEAVRWFQRKNKLSVDGIAGSKTLAAMGISSSSSSSSSSGGGAGTSDLNLLARAVYGEGRGEPYAGQVAIAAVILNRVEDSRFPKTVAGVVYQAGAFDVVADGQINLSPNNTAYQAARDALNGWDPTYGCVYYYNPATATNKWIKTLPITVRIGKHVFSKGK